ncbi:MAG TPA: hypothetical protein ENN30_02195 [Candidatus Woesearchaeota archaeon]|nr:hypothetical protein [Candidatus Woesearchaeota archaeon]
MKTPEIGRLSKRGQYAVPFILLAVIAVFILYIILVYPEERQEMLMGPISDIEESPLGEGTKLIFSSGQTNEIGRATSGNIVFSFALPSMSVSYPIEEKTIALVHDAKISSSIFTAGTQELEASNLNLENTKDVILYLNISDVKGNPSLFVYLNDTLVYQSTPSKGSMTITFEPGALQPDRNPIIIRVEHNGMDFWAKHTISFSEINLKQRYYNPSEVSSKEYVPISESNYVGNTFKLFFTPTNAVTDGDLILKINNKAVWSGKPIANQTNAITLRLEDSNIKIGTNEIAFEADRGGEYKLTKIIMDFVSGAAPMATKTYSFDIPREDIESGRNIIIGIRVDRIIDPGSLYFTIDPYSTSYYFDAKAVASGAWSYAEIPQNKLSQFGNKITLSSPDGRFRITGFVVVLA